MSCEGNSRARSIDPEARAQLSRIGSMKVKRSAKLKHTLGGFRAATMLKHPDHATERRAVEAQIRTAIVHDARPRETMCRDRSS